MIRSCQECEFFNKVKRDCIRKFATPSNGEFEECRKYVEMENADNK